MESKIIELAMNQGIYAVLFVFLFFYVLRENSKREANYQNIIKELSTILNEKIKSIEYNICEFMKK